MLSISNFSAILTLCASLTAACDIKTGERKKQDEFTPDEVANLAFDPSVTDLYDATFDKAVLGSDDSWVIFFYSPMCPHCQKTAPSVSDAAVELSGKVNFGAVNVNTEDDLVEQFRIEHYPSFGYWDSEVEKTRENMKLSFEIGHSKEDISAFARDLISEDHAQKTLVETKMAQVFANEALF